MSSRSAIGWLATIALCAGIANVAHAEPPPARDWDLAVFAYVWAAGIEAEVDTPIGSVEIDESFTDILKDLELGAMGLIDARWRRFVLVFDGVYTKVGDASDVLGGRARVDQDLTQVVLDTKVGFRLLDMAAPWADGSSPEGPRLIGDLLAGARYWYNGFDVDVEFANGEDRKFSPSRDWVDPLVGLRLGAGITRTVNVSFIGDVGGFDIGNSSELTWMVMPSLNWRPWHRVSFHVGYKHLHVDRERPSTGNDFDYTMSGPFVGAGFHF